MITIDSGRFVDENALIGREGTVVTAAWLNAAQDEIVAMVTRFGGKIGQGNTQIADTVERWRTRGDHRAALDWSAVDTQALDGEILWAGQIYGEPICITNALEIARLTDTLVADKVGQLATATTAEHLAVHDEGAGAFSIAFVSTNRAVTLFRCSLSCGVTGTALQSAPRWSKSLGFPETPLDLSIARSRVRLVTARSVELFGQVIHPLAYNLTDGAVVDGGLGFGRFPSSIDSTSIKIAACGPSPADTIVAMAGTDVTHTGLEGEMSPVSTDANWLNAVGQRRLRYFPKVDRVCLWTSHSPGVWLADPSVRPVSWRRIELSGPIVDLVEYEGALLGLSVGQGSLDCHQIPVSESPRRLSSTIAPGFSPDITDIYSRRAWATVTRGVLWGRGYGYLFASADPTRPFALRPTARSPGAATWSLVSASYGGRALGGSGRNVHISGMF